MIGIVDYGAGNLKSVKKAFDFLGSESKILRGPEEFQSVDRVVLPGVGSFGHAVQCLGASGMMQPVLDWIQEDRSFLGICLGLQMLFEMSEETRGISGLSLMKGFSRKFKTGKVPQIGWNNIRKTKESPLFSGIKSGEFFYFVHSFYVDAGRKENVLAVSDYFVEFVCAAGTGNVYGVQFHPEKSGEAGLRLLGNWVKKC